MFKKTLPLIFIMLVVAAPQLALASPGGTGLETFGSSLLDFLVGTLGPIVLVLGVALAAYSMIFGSRDGMQKAGMVRHNVAKDGTQGMPHISKQIRGCRYSRLVFLVIGRSTIEKALSQ